MDLVLEENHNRTRFPLVQFGFFCVRSIYHLLCSQGVALVWVCSYGNAPVDKISTGEMSWEVLPTGYMLPWNLERLMLLFPYFIHYITDYF